jgi:excisionase family DNA binding protein
MAATKTAPAPASTPSSAPCLTVADVAIYLGVSTRCVQHMVSDGRLRAYRLGPRVIRLRLSDVEAALRPYGSA